jgi:hypothetical protein
LVLICGALLSKFAFKLNSRRYITRVLPFGMQSYYGNHNGELENAIARYGHVAEPSLSQIFEDGGHDSFQMSSFEAGAYIRSNFSST